MWHSSRLLVEGNAWQREAAVADRTHHEIGGQSRTATSANHEALGIDHGSLDLDRGHSVIADDLCRSAPEVEANAARGPAQRTSRPILQHDEVAGRNLVLLHDRLA